MLVNLIDYEDDLVPHLRTAPLRVDKTIPDKLIRKTKDSIMVMMMKEISKSHQNLWMLFHYTSRLDRVDVRVSSGIEVCSGYVHQADLGPLLRSRVVAGTPVTYGSRGQRQHRSQCFQWRRRGEEARTRFIMSFHLASYQTRPVSGIHIIALVDVDPAH